MNTIRGLAITAVALIHCLGAAFYTDQLPWHGVWRSFEVGRLFLLLTPLTYGWAGVAIFFVVSGFCVHLSHQRSGSKDWTTYATRRFFRIYPPYLATLLVFSWLFPWPVDWGDPAGRWVFGSHFLLIHNFDHATVFGINASFWSIAVEFQLYALYPLLLVLVRRCGWGAAVVVTAVTEFALRGGAAVLVGSNGAAPAWLEFNPLFFWFSWTIGAALAERFLHGRVPRFRAWHVGLSFGTFIATQLYKPSASFSFPVAAICTACVIGLVLNLRQAGVARVWPRWIDRIFSPLGICSYSFYLIHQPIIFGALPILIAWLAPGGHSALFRLLTGLLALPVIALISVVLYRLLELPSISWGKSILARLRARSPARFARAP